MTKLHSSEIQALSDAEMEEHLSQLKKDLMKIKGVLASGGVPEDLGKVRQIKRTIARIHTEKQIRKGVGQ
ncbi:MAG TPA: 50S ribosomal protein L29 [Candidatus Altiarchaeales archaeon]|nr:50S ribosomal protein L29 [Candidatus Altiarchaeales archaeon]